MCVCVCVCVCVVSYLTVLQFYLLLWLAVIHSDVVQCSRCPPTLWLGTFTHAHKRIIIRTPRFFLNSTPVLQRNGSYTYTSRSRLFQSGWLSPENKDRCIMSVRLTRRHRFGNAVRWMEGASRRGRTPSFRHAWRSKGGQVVTLVCRTRSPLLFTPQVYELQPSWLVVFTCRERHTHVHTVFMCIPAAGKLFCIAMQLHYVLQKNYWVHEQGIFFWHLPPDWLVVHLAFVWSRQWRHIDHSKHLPPYAECIPENIVVSTAG